MTGCSTVTTYKPAGEGNRLHGWEEVKLANGNYHLKYIGNIEAKEQVVYDLFMRRANDLSKIENKPCFKIESGQFITQVDHIGFMARSLPTYQGDVVFCGGKK